MLNMHNIKDKLKPPTITAKNFNPFGGYYLWNLQLIGRSPGEKYIAKGISGYGDIN